jgi:hypothetical protein
VRRINWVIGSTGSTVESVVPLSSDFGASRNGDNGLRNRRVVWIDSTVTDDIYYTLIRREVEATGF